eukprot:9147467-Heterocapsa_arctica.AAC.1
MLTYAEARTKQYLLRLEGLFQKMDPDAERSPAGMLARVTSLFLSMGSVVDVFIAALEDGLTLNNTTTTLTIKAITTSQQNEINTDYYYYYYQYSYYIPYSY